MADKLGLIGPAMEQPEYNLFNRKKARRPCCGPLILTHTLLLPCLPYPEYTCSSARRRGVPLWAPRGALKRYPHPIPLAYAP